VDYSARFPLLKYSLLSVVKIYYTAVYCLFKNVKVLNQLLSLLKGLVSSLIIIACTTHCAKAQRADSSMLIHTVQPGENLYRISLKYNVTMAQVMHWNGITSAGVLKAGQVLKIWQKKPSEGIDVKLEIIPGELPEEGPEEEIWKDTKPQKLKRDSVVEAPRDTPPPKKPLIKINPLKPDSTKQAENEQLVYTGTRIAPKEEEFDTTGRLDISGYISAYYAYYTDSVGPDQPQKFPTLAPHSDEVGINGNCYPALG
jgi:LysM repeat protein